jgi:uncharacterized protein YbjT (DUF2867 family)
MNGTSDGSISSDTRRILVVGGTGTVGAPISRQLNLGGWGVRVLSRNPQQARDKFAPAVDLVSGKADSRDDVARAIEGCRAVLVCVSDLTDPYLDLRATETAASVAQAAGLERIGLISGASVAEERRYFPMIDAKYKAEERLKSAGTPWTIFRLTWLMESFPRFVQGNRAVLMGHQPAVVHSVAGDDVGRMVSRAFDLDEAAGRTFCIHGPEAGTMKSFLEKYCALVRPQARVSTAPFWMMSIVAALTRNRELKAVVGMMKYFEDLPEFGDPAEADRLLGAPVITLEQWAAGIKEAERSMGGVRS